MTPLIFLGALPFMLFGMTADLRAQQQETGPVARRVIIFVWDYAKVSSSLRFGSAPQIGCATLNSPHAAVRSTAHRSVVASFRSGSAIRP